MWKYKGSDRPEFAIEPKDNEESVWDYPRPPVLVDDTREVRVYGKDHILLASSIRSIRVLETASPPSFYLHPSDILVELDQDEGHTWCEWKGKASYFVYKGLKVAWRYENPSERFARIDGWYSFYPGKASCFVSGEPVKAQIGQFYGGWITNEIVGPFKGGSGTNAW